MEIDEQGIEAEEGSVESPKNRPGGKIFSRTYLKIILKCKIKGKIQIFFF